MPDSDPAPSRLRILGLDLATTTGWCLMQAVDLANGQAIIPIATTGHFSLPEPSLARADRNMRQYVAFGRYFHGLLDQHTPDIVAYEYSSAPRSRFGNAHGRASASVEFAVMRQLSLFEGFLVAYSNELIPQYGYRLVSIGTSEIHEHYTRAAASKKASVWAALEALYAYDLSGFTADEKDAIAICRFAFEFIRRPWSPRATTAARASTGARRAR